MIFLSDVKIKAFMPVVDGVMNKSWWSEAVATNSISIIFRMWRDKRSCAEAAF